MRPLLCFPFFLLYYGLLPHPISAVHSASELFPSLYEEYDGWIFDPEHGYGSPFGGFSRATRSRIAALPLLLPNTDSQLPNPNALHTEVRDSSGRLFVCRVYHEDELDGVSLNEGMFEVPKLRQDDEANPPSALIETGKNDAEITEINPGDSTEPDNSSVRRMDEESETLSLAQLLKTIDEKERIAEIDNLLEPLSGLCAQTHKGWWSYEWCYKDRVTQFHVEISKSTSSVQVEDVTNLGNFDSRAIVLVDPDEGEALDSKGKVMGGNLLAQGRPELARVDDTYLHGTLCPGTNKERQSLVRLVCCSKGTVQNNMGLVHRDNVHVTTDVMSIYDVRESNTNICTYNVTICTPLLCLDEEDEEENTKTEGGYKLKDKNSMSVPAKENESVMEVLERTMNGFCLQTSTGGWWTYEICHKKNIRQYHEVVGTRKNKNGAVYTARTVEADHNLGSYQPNVFAAIVPEDEWKFVVNATDKKGGVVKPYFELEYTGGDVCDHSDVTDAAIVAGGSTQKGISRSSSVRYQCGDNYDISVSEDSTCHYIVIVELPDLCSHPLFKQPVSKKQVFKCLYVPEDDSSIA